MSESLPVLDAYSDEDANFHTGRLLVNKLLDLRLQFPKGTGLSQYVARASDVVITTFPKAGTTLLQQLCYQLAVLSGGAGAQDRTGEEFTDITEVCTWVDYFPQFNLAPYEMEPRVLKTHSRPRAFAENGHVLQKHVVVVRDPRDYPASWLDFLYESAVSNGAPEFAQLANLRGRRGVRKAAFDEFVRLELLQERPPDDLQRTRPRLDWFQFVSEWFAVYANDTRNPDRRRILVLFYEDIVADLGATVRKVAPFMGLEPPSRELADVVVGRCSRKYMGGNEKFRCQVEARLFNLGSRALKARRQDDLGFREFGIGKDEMCRLQARFQNVFGVDSYDEMKNRFKKDETFLDDLRQRYSAVTS